MFDGKVARTKKKRTIEERNFGVQLDSLSDLVCFGVLPAMIGYSLGIKQTYLVPLVILYPLAALIRLAYFNMLEIIRKEYTGLPVTSAALIFPFLYIFKKFIGTYFPYVYAGLLLLVGILFISRIKIKKPGIKTMIIFIIVGVIEILLIITVRRLLWNM